MFAKTGFSAQPCSNFFGSEYVWYVIKIWDYWWPLSLWTIRCFVAAPSAKTDTGPSVVGQTSANVSQDEVGLNDTSSHDAADGKGVIPTFEEFLEYILSTDLQGKFKSGCNVINTRTRNDVRK